MEKVKSISGFNALNLSDLAKIKGGLMSEPDTPATQPGNQPATPAKDPRTQPDTPARP